MPKITATWDKNMQPFYHFTTYENFCQILNSGEIKLSPCTSRKNAAVEVMALYSVLNKIIDENNIESILKNFSCDNKSELIKQIIQYRNNSYIACFTKFNKDNEIEEIAKSDYLWEFYGDRGNGVVIKFDYNCFPYEKRGSRSKIINENEVRLPELRIDDVIYDDKKLIRYLDSGDSVVHLFITDIYKPEFCRVENEKRLLVYLRDRNDYTKINELIEKEIIKNGKTKRELFYNLQPKQALDNKGILKVFCKNIETKNKLLKIIDSNLVAHLN